MEEYEEDYKSTDPLKDLEIWLIQRAGLTKDEFGDYRYNDVDL